MQTHKSPVIFDTLARLLSKTSIRVPSQFLPWLEMIRQSALFWMPLIPHKDLPKAIEEERADWLRENMYLPFPVVAIEDRASLVILADPVVEDRDVLRGAAQTRFFIHVYPMNENLVDSEGFNDSSEHERLAREQMKVIGTQLNLVVGDISMQDIAGTRVGYSSNIRDGFFVDGDGVVRFDCNDMPEIARHGVIRNVGCGIQELCLLIDPEHFILERTPVKTSGNPFPKRKRWIEREAKKIPGSEERAVYTILKPQEIRNALGLEQPEAGHASPTPHERRRHIRRLMSERFVHKKGKTVIVKSTWVGASEAVRGNKRYRVMLDH